MARPACATCSSRRARPRPSIIFIDELDAIGRTRGSGAQIGGHDEREQTLNQILTEMDGFDSREGVIVLAATNRADVLDQALLRPGRFDRRVVVQRPDRAGRAAILKVHTKNVPLAPDVSSIAWRPRRPVSSAPNCAIWSTRRPCWPPARTSNAVSAEDFAEALQKITLGPARNILLNPADRERTAYHEAGHALLALLIPGSDPVHRVSIVPRGMALGATYQLPVDDRTSYAEDYLQARITGALGGRAAEKLDLRRDDDGRRERPPAGDGDRPPHGVALGDEREARPDQLRRAAGRWAAGPPSSTSPTARPPRS